MPRRRRGPSRSQSVRQTQLLPPPHKISQQFLHCISNSHFFFQVARSLARGGLKRGERGGKVAGWLARLLCSRYLISSSGRVFGYLWRRGSGERALAAASAAAPEVAAWPAAAAAWFGRACGGREGGRRYSSCCSQSVSGWLSLVRFCRLPPSLPSVRPSVHASASVRQAASLRTHARTP